MHLDHSANAEDIGAALARGINRVMADGTQLSFEDNLRFSREMAGLAHAYGAVIEAELDKLSGTEDDRPGAGGRVCARRVLTRSRCVLATCTDVTVASCAGLRAAARGDDSPHD